MSTHVHQCRLCGKIVTTATETPPAPRPCEFQLGVPDKSSTHVYYPPQVIAGKGPDKSSQAYLARYDNTIGA